MRAAVGKSEVSGCGFGRATFDTIKDMIAAQSRTPLLDDLGFIESPDCTYAIAVLTLNLEVNAVQRVYTPKKKRCITIHRGFSPDALRSARCVILGTVSHR